jgi:hypothetical protein
MSAILGGATRKTQLRELLFLNKPRSQEPLLNEEQLAVVNKVLGYSGLKVTTTVTVISSIAALFIVILKSSRMWWWWVFIAVVCVGFITWAWVYTGNPGKFADKKVLSISKATWVLIIFCAFDTLLAILSVFAALLQPLPKAPLH